MAKNNKVKREALSLLVNLCTGCAVLEQRPDMFNQTSIGSSYNKKQNTIDISVFDREGISKVTITPGLIIFDSTNPRILEEYNFEDYDCAYQFEFQRLVSPCKDFSCQVKVIDKKEISHKKVFQKRVKESCK